MLLLGPRHDGRGMNVIHLTAARGAGLRRGVSGSIRIAALVASACLAASAAWAQPELPRPDDGYFQNTVRVTEGVWLLTEPRFQLQPIGNVIVIEQSDGLVMVDAGGSPGAGRRIVETIRGLSSKAVKAVVITHWHGDHPQGLSEVLKAWPRARTIATRATQAHLRDPATMNTPGAPDASANAAFQKQVKSFVAYAHQMGDKATDPAEKAHWAEAERQFRQYALDMDGAVTLPVAEGFDDRLDLPDVRRPAQALFLGRANTDGDALVWLPRQRILITGDIVVSPVPFGFGGYPADWIATLAKLRRYDFRILIPGHGAPQHDRAYIDRVSAALADIRAQVAPLAEAGLSLEQVRAQVDASAQAHSFIGEDPWLQHWFIADWVNPIVASAYREAKGEPIVQSLKGD